MSTKKAAAKKPTEQAVAVLPAPAVPAAEPKKPSLRIIAMQVENIKRVRFARIRPKGDTVIISGANGSGKSSVLDAIEWGLCGTSSIPTQPIRKGERTGTIQIQLGDFNITRHFTRVDAEKSAKGSTYITKLTVEGRNREQFRSPQELLDGLMGKISFDPLAFTRMDGKKQFETLRGLVTLDVDLDALEAEKKAAYDARRDAGRDLDAAKSRLAVLPVPAEGLPEEAIDTAAITHKLEGAANHNSIVASRERQKQSCIEASQKQRDLAEESRKLAADLRREAEAADRLAVERDEQAAQELQLAGEVDIPTVIDTAEVAAELTNAQNINGAIQRRVVYRTVEQQVTDYNAAWEAQDAIVKAKDKERADAIARAKMPIEGLSIGDGEVLYTGLPFEQASNAEQIRVSVALAMASNPQLHVLRIKDGSLLDSKTLGIISDMAEANKYQVWIERVDTGGKVGIVMEDGEASGEEVEKVEGAKK